jgi:hypothetical protein
MAVSEGHRLLGTDGFVVESPDGDVGWVEEVWLGDDGEPRALAVQTVEGRHGLLRQEDVEAVDREEEWVVVPHGLKLLELDAPRVRTANGHVIASWSTTGEVLEAPARPPWHWPLHLPQLESRPHPRMAAVGRRVRRWPPWLAAVVLICSLGFILAVMMTLAFLIAKIVTGSAY